MALVMLGGPLLVGLQMGWAFDSVLVGVLCGIGALVVLCVASEIGYAKGAREAAARDEARRSLP